MNRVSNTLWGIVFIVIGVIFGLNALEITNINIFFDGWWTLFIIVPCFIDLFKEKEKPGNFIGLLIGICLLLCSLEIISFHLLWKLLVPAILILIGLSFIFKDIFQGEIKKEIKRLNKNDSKEYCAVFSGQDLDFSGEEFTGCSLSAVFGGVKCDLRKAKIKEDVVIHTSSVFSGITILVPDDVRVKINSSAIFGGVSDDRKHKNNESKVTIYISASSMFGGVEIK